MWLWLASFGRKSRRYAWIRWSYAFRGFIPHFGVAEGVRWKTLSVVEYIPPKADCGTWRNLVILFRGRYRVWRFRIEAVKRFDTRQEALAFALFKKGKSHESHRN